jgi:acetyl-CoA carboxylase biotin carboxylase subunit
MSMNQIKKLLIANRGEIAVRVIRAAKELGIETVAVYSDVDQGAMHVRLADHRICLGGKSAKESYLNQEKLILAVIQSGADAVHPGYGFFAENAGFADAVRAEGVSYVGPSSEVISLMGDKHEARKHAQTIGVPVIPGMSKGASVSEIKKFAEGIQYPVIVKAVAGGSGRGMRVVTKESELEEKLGEAIREAESSFGNGEVIVEKFLEKPRHIEAQIFGDKFGNVIHFGLRDCSVQRRNQKIIEEAGEIVLNGKLAEKILESAVKLGKSVNYLGAGTIEFLVEGGLDENSPFYFLEMNTRIQVEHTVSEEIYGVDLVKLQLEVEQGKKIATEEFGKNKVGHAIQFRINSEDPKKNFAPTSGRLLYVSRAGGIGVREDGWVESGTEISPYYDSLLTKLIITGNTRAEAIARAKAVLDDFVIDGLETTLSFHRYFVRTELFQEGIIDVRYLEREYKGEILPAKTPGPIKVLTR